MQQTEHWHWRAVVANLPVSHAKICTAGHTARGCIVLWCSFVSWSMSLWFFENFSDNFTFVRGMAEIYRHGIWSAIHCWIGLVFANVGYAVARKTANLVLMDNSDPSILVVVTVVYWRQERFEIANEIKKMRRNCFLWAWNLRVQSSGSGYFTTCGGLRTYSGVWQFRMSFKRKRVETPIAYECYSVIASTAADQTEHALYAYVVPFIILTQQK